ncbi:MAG: inorganic diphosphatase [Terriglobia bacterium]
MLHQLDPGPQCPAIVQMIVEIPKNSNNKYEYDTKIGVFRLDRTLYSPMHYPGDYGFIPGTLAQDGDPLDVIVLTDEPTFTGCMLEARPVGLLRMADEKGPDDKVLAVPERNPRYTEIETVDEVFPHVRLELEHFFDIYKELEGKKTEIKGWLGLKETHEFILQARKRYADKHRAPLKHK